MPVYLDSRQIHLWCCFYSGITDKHLLEAYREVLSDSEKQREGGFYFPENRRCYLITRALVRTVLSRYADIRARDWRFVTNRYGKPEIANEDVDRRRISFNVTHTRGLIVVAIAPTAVGVDAENVWRGDVSTDLADRFFAVREAAALRRLSRERQRKRFFEYWTLKEAYIKACGKGLSIPLDSFCFDFRGEREIEFSVESDETVTPSRWCFYQLAAGVCHLLAVCAQTRVGRRLDLLVRNEIPLVSTCESDCVLLRSSSSGTLQVTGECARNLGVQSTRESPDAECLCSQSVSLQDVGAA
jgi:4'-phosphopantetheinyl transferase